MWPPGSRMSWPRQSPPARAASSASTTCRSSPGSHAGWLSCRRRSAWQLELTRKGRRESTAPRQAPPLTRATLQRHPLFLLPAQSPSSVLSSPSVLPRRGGGRGLPGLPRVQACCFSPGFHLGARQPKDMKLWAREPSRLCISLWRTACRKELLVKWACAPCFSLQRDWRLKGHTTVTVAHALWTDTKQAKMKKKEMKKIFFLPLIY